MHRPDEFITALRKYFPEEPVLPLYYMMKGDLQAARRQKTIEEPRMPGRPMIFEMSYLLAPQGRRRRSEELLAKVLRETSISTRATYYHHFTYDIACIFAINGNAQEAMNGFVPLRIPIPFLYAVRARPVLDKTRRAAAVQAVHGRNGR